MCSATQYKSEDICRLCMCETVNCYVDLFEYDCLQSSSYPILQAIEDLITIRITSDDGLPSHICSRCNESLTLLHEFKSTSLYSQTVLRNQLKCFNTIENDEAIKRLDGMPMCNVYLDVYTDEQDDTKEREAKKHEKSTNSFEIEHQSDNDSTLPLETSTGDENDDDKTKFRNTIRASDVHDIPISTAESILKRKFKGIAKNTRRVLASPITGKSRDKSTKFACEVCGKTMCSSDLKDHLNVHKGLKTIRCLSSDCETRFSGIKGMRRHYKLSHSKVLLQCDFCERMFKSKPVLKAHLTYHKEPSIPCSVCGKMQYTSYSLRKHMMTHTGERPHPCGLCPKSFQNRYNLKVHNRIHTKEKPFACAKCGVTFGYNSLLKAHTEKYHPET